MRRKKFKMPKINKQYIDHILALPQYAQQSKYVVGLIDDFRRDLPDKVLGDFDRIRDTVNKWIIISYFGKFLEKSDEFVFDIPMIIVSIVSQKKQNIKTPRIWKNLDIIHKIALEKAFAKIKQSKAGVRH